MKLFPHARRPTLQSGQDGYVLLTLLLTVALLIIMAAAIMPTIKFQIEHDREEEMIHRGVQYSRAIRAYYKKFGRYPTRLEELESSNNMRFLRKRYKDPMSCVNGECKEFKLLHFGEVKMSMGAGLINGAVPAGALSGQNPGFGGQPSPLGGNSPLNQVLAQAGNLGPGVLGANSGLGANPQQAAAATGSDTSANSDANGTQGVSADKTGGADSTSSTQQVFGGGPIVGVVSLSKKEGYREFNHKKKYNEWQFIYDPGTDRGGLLMTPNQPPLMPGGLPGQNTGGPINNGLAGGSTGQTPTGTQNNLFPPPTGLGNPNQQQNSPQQNSPQQQ